jgi:hypothetical protein
MADGHPSAQLLIPLYRHEEFYLQHPQAAVVV